jgi:hypothetical protein
MASRRWGRFSRPLAFGARLLAIADDHDAVARMIEDKRRDDGTFLDR